MSSPDMPPTEGPPHAGYEKRDVHLKPLLWLVGVVSLVIAGSYIGLYYLLGTMQSAALRADPRLSPLADIDQTPPGPRLQHTPYRDYDEFLASQEAHLNSYGWVDREQGIVRIPVAQAFDLALQHGLPTPSAAPAQEDAAPAAPDDGAPPAEESP